MNEVVGYAHIKANAEQLIVSEDPKSFLGNIVRVLEFERGGSSILAINSQANAIAMIEGDAISRKFKCGVFNNYIITPPDLDIMDQMLYATKCTSRKGGYPEIIGKMVIAASLAKGEFTDGFLWELQ